MKAVHILVRRYCKKSFTLPKIDFKYKDVENSGKKEIGLSRRQNDAQLTSAKYDSLKIKQSHQKINSRFQSNTKLSSSVDNTGATDKRVQRQLYSRDLLETESDYFFSDKLNKRRVVRKDNKYFQSRDKRVAKSTFQVQKDREIVYGIFPVLFALQTNRRTLFKLYIKQGISTINEKIQLIQEICLKNGIPTQFVPKTALQQLTNYDAVHQGVCLEASRLPMLVTDENSLESFCTDSIKCWIYLNGINDPMNLGAILRTSYFLGVEKVLCSAVNSCPVTSVVSKASAGIAEFYPLYNVPNDESYLSACQKQGWQIVSSSSSYMKNSIEIESFCPKKNVILIIGNEGRGISEEILELSDVCVSIPPHEQCKSEMMTLNASVASSIILFSIMSKLKLIGGA